MRVNINNEEGFGVKDREEAVRVIEEKTLKFIKEEGDHLKWYKSDQRLDEPDIAAVYNKRHEETRYFVRIIGQKYKQ